MDLSYVAKFVVLSCLVLALSTVASAQFSCQNAPAPSPCTEVVATYASGKYVQISGAPDPAPQIAMIQAIPLCTSCKENLINLICKLSYIEAVSCGTFPTVRVPNQATCEATYSGCVPADLPEATKNAITAALQEGTGGTCSELYASIDQFPPSFVTKYADTVKPQGGCSCSTPDPTDDLGICTGIVNYPVWDVLPYFSTSVSAGINSVYASTTASLNAVPGLACPDCLAQVKQTFCSAAYLKCDLPSNKLGIPPCTSVCNDILDTCRISELVEPSIVNFINATGFSDDLDISQLSTISTMCSTTGLFSDAAGCNADPTPKERCPCVQPTLAANAVCAPYVDYEIFPVLASMATEIQHTVSTSLSVLSGDFGNIVCPGCKAALTQVACMAGFPRCTPTRSIAAVCSNSCEDIMRPCGLPSMDKFCTEGPASVLPQTGCVPVTPPARDACTYCGRKPELTNCGSLADWDTFTVSLPGLNVATYDNQFGTFFNTIKFPSCTECQNQIKRTLCSIFIMPCSINIIDKLVSTYLDSPAGTKPSTNEIINLLPRPCFSRCSDVFSSCLLTLNATQQLFFKCDTTFPAFPFPLFSQVESACYNHTYPPLPPPTCPILRGGAPSTGNSTEGVSGGVVAALVVCVGVLPVAGAGAVVVMWLKKMWIFKIPTVKFPEDEEFSNELNPMNSPASGAGSNRDTWHKSNVPARVTNLGS